MKPEKIELTCAVMLDGGKEAEAVFVSMEQSRSDFDVDVKSLEEGYEGGCIMVPIIFSPEEPSGQEICNILKSLIVLDDAMDSATIDSIFGRFFKEGFNAGRKVKDLT